MSDITIVISRNRKPTTTQVKATRCLKQEFPGLELYAHRDFVDPDLWNVTEKLSGRKVTDGYFSTRKTAIENAKLRVEGAGLDRVKAIAQEYKIAP